MVSEKEGGYEIVHEGMEDVLKVDARRWSSFPSLEDDPALMGYVIDRLIENPSVNRLVFVQQKHITYPYDQVKMLREISVLYNYLAHQKKIIQLLGLDESNLPFYSEKRNQLQQLLYFLLRTDPIGCYVDVVRLKREETIALGKETQASLRDARMRVITILDTLQNMLLTTTLITHVRDRLDGFAVGDRSLYREMFKPFITPDFLYTQFTVSPPRDAEEIEAYRVGQHAISLFKLPGEVKILSHVIPQEFTLEEDAYTLLELAKTVLSEHTPKEEHFLEPERMRTTFYHIGKDLLNELATNKGMELDYRLLETLSHILVRHTVGFGLLEILLHDPKIQDVVINSPVGSSPVFIVHQDYGECVTNLYPSNTDAEGWATKFRLLSGRPLDEAHPVLDADLSIPGARSRVAIMTRPLSPQGLAFAFRRHRDKPWTLPLFIHHRMITPLGAGLISFFIDGARTLLVAGTRSSGKTSLLGSFLVEIMRKYRIISVEDTLELPLDALKTLGYNIQSMKVRSALLSGGVEVSADEGIRTSLRLGDSALIVGEVRSLEAKALYEAMRIGALANVVAGTIHGASPYGVYDRVVNDLGVPKTSFKATDIIVVANPVRSADGLRSSKRVLQIAEVRKHWQDDPIREGGFVTLMEYNSKHDVLEPTKDLLNGDSDVVKSVAGSVREWVGNWDAVWDNIVLRADLKRTLVETAVKTGYYDLLEADFVVRANDSFHRVCEDIQTEVGGLDSKRIAIDWRTWLQRSLKERRTSK